MTGIPPRESQITFGRTVGIKVLFNSTLAAKIFFDKYNQHGKHDDSLNEKEIKTFDDFLPLYLEFANLPFNRYRTTMYMDTPDELPPFQMKMIGVLGDVIDGEIEDKYNLEIKLRFEDSDDWKKHFVYGVSIDNGVVFISELDDKYYDYPMTQDEFIKILYPVDKIEEAIEKVKIFTRENDVNDDEIKVYMC